MKLLLAIIKTACLIVNSPDAENLGVLLYVDLSVNHDNESSGEVLQSLEENLEILMKVYWETEERTGCDKTKTITLTLKDQPAVIVLERIADQLGDENNKATWQLRDGVVEVGLKSQMSKKSFQRLVTYPITDLLFVVGDFSMMDSGLSRNPPTQSPATKQRRIDNLIKKITTLIEPKTWEQNGGPCTITNYKETLLVRAPDFVHRQLGGYSFEPIRPNDNVIRKVSYGKDGTTIRKTR